MMTKTKPFVASAPFTRAVRRGHALHAVRAHRERGAALITALLVVTLAAVLVSGLLWRQQVQIRRVENQRQEQQAQWVSRGSFSWTRLILRSEADSAPITYLGGVWSVPIAETKLSDFLGKIGGARADEGASTWLSGSIEDAQAKFNLRDLVTGTGAAGLVIDPLALARLKKLLSLLSINSDLSSAIAARVRDSLTESVTRVQKADTGNMASSAQAVMANGGRAQGGYSDDPGMASSDNGRSSRPLPMHSLDALLDVPGVTADTLEKLAPFVTILPVPTQINLNTASAEVVAASIPALSLSAAQSFTRLRDQTFLINMTDAQTRLQMYAANIGTLDPDVFDVTSRFFVVHGRVRHERAVVDRVALIFRDARTHATQIVQVRDAATVIGLDGGIRGAN